MASLIQKGSIFHGRHIFRQNGKRREITKSLKTSNRRLAYLRLAEWEKELDAQRFGEAYSPLFREASRRWINSASAGLSPTTVHRYETSLAQLVDFLGDKRVDQIAPADLSRFVTKRRRDPGRRYARPGEKGIRADKHNRHGRPATKAKRARKAAPRDQQSWAPVSDVSIQRDLACLSAFMGYAVVHGWAAENIVPAFRKAQQLRTGQARTRYLSHAEEARLLAAAARPRTFGPHVNDHNRRMFVGALVLALETGLRKAELMGLKWQDVQLGRRSHLQVTGKGGKERQVPLSQRGQDVVRELPVSPGAGHVISRENGKPWASFDKALDEACRVAGIQDFTWHDLRRTAGTRWLQGGMSMKHVSLMLGHSSIQVTERHYAFLSVDDLHIALDQIDQRRAAGGHEAKVLPMRRRPA